MRVRAVRRERRKLGGKKKGEDMRKEGSVIVWREVKGKEAEGGARTDLGGDRRRFKREPVGSEGEIRVGVYGKVGGRAG